VNGGFNVTVVNFESTEEPKGKGTTILRYYKKTFNYKQGRNLPGSAVDETPREGRVKEARSPRA